MGEPWPDEQATLARFPRGGEHETRVQIAKTGGRLGVSVRLWIRGRDGHWHPTRRGVCISPVELGVLAASIDEARSRLAAGGVRAARPS
ncbi:MAG: hypothetical protein JNM10_05350 [Planctomycetia bacterium]|nr:hypothetical protein [Planctomycetia bacterium]